MFHRFSQECFSARDPGAIVQCWKSRTWRAGHDASVRTRIHGLAQTGGPGVRADHKRQFGTAIGVAAAVTVAAFTFLDLLLNSGEDRPGPHLGPRPHPGPLMTDAGDSAKRTAPRWSGTGARTP